MKFRKTLLIFSIFMVAACTNQQKIKQEEQQQFDQKYAKHYCFKQQNGTLTKPSGYYLENCYKTIIFPPVVLDIQNKNVCGEVTHQKFLIQTVQVKN